MTRPYRRRWIVGKFPNRFSGRNVNFFILLFLLFAACLFGPLIYLMEYTDQGGYLSQDRAAVYLLELQKVIWPAVGLLFGLLFVATVIFTHRIAGPLYRIRNILKVIGEGNLAIRASIRKRDYLHLEVDCINEMLVGLRGRMLEVNARYREAQTSVLELSKASGGGLPHDLAPQLTRLQEQMDRLGNCLAEFKVEQSPQ